MCKLHGYHYACGHIVRYRLSRCRGTFTKLRSRRPTKSRLAACAAECYIVITSDSLCGSCLYEEFRAHWNARISDAERAYSNALDQGMKSGLGLWDWGAVGWGGGDDDGGPDGFDHGCIDGCDADSHAGDSTDESPERTATNKKHVGAKNKNSLKVEIERRRRTLESLRAEFSADSWSVRTRLPTIERKPYAYPSIQPRVCHAASPLRNEVRPEDVALKLERHRKADVDDDGWGNHSNFQAFFADTYSDGSGDAWGNDASILTETYSWDASALANISFVNSLSDGTAEASGDESYYAEYNRYATSRDAEENDPDEPDEASVMAYGPETRFPPLMSKAELLALGPDAAPP